ncbi:MAG: hypothetical protein U5N86_03195 [Planctomycetota bacterium]|nr:hypothetical protein [Planctomycetota bacterium]
MPDPTGVKREIGGKEIQLKRQVCLPNRQLGSVVASCGGTKVMAAATWNPEASPDQDFFPLTVDYREMTYASGKIPGSFFRREGRPSEREVLCSRLIDRPLRPQFPDGFFNDVNIMLLAISFDQENESDVLAQVAAAAALAVSDIPMKRTIGSIRVGLVAGELVANPLKAEQEKADMDLLLSGSKDGICMVEAGAAQVPEDKVLDGIEFGHKMICEVVELIEELAAAGGKAKAEIKEPETPSPYDDA